MRDERVLPVGPPPFGNLLRSRTGILGQQHGVAFCRVEVERLEHVTVQLVAPLGGEGEELPDGKPRLRERFLQRCVVIERAHPFAGGVENVGTAGGGAAAAFADVVGQVGAGIDRIVTVAGSEALLVLAVESDSVEVAFQGRTFGRDVVNLVAAQSDEIGNFPLTLRNGVKHTLADAVQVEVHITRRGLLPNDETASVFQEIKSLVEVIDVFGRAFVIDHLLRAIRIAQYRFEMVLTTVHPLETEPSVGRPFRLKDVLSPVGTDIDTLRFARFKVVNVEIDHRIGVARFGVFERIGFVIELAVVTHHLENGYAGFVETQVGDLLSVGRKSVSLREGALLFIYPVGRTVDNPVPCTVCRDRTHGIPDDVVEVEVVAAREGDRPSVGRERSVARVGQIGQNGAQAVGVFQVVIGGIGVPVDRFGADREQQQFSVG